MSLVATIQSSTPVFRSRMPDRPQEAPSVASRIVAARTEARRLYADVEQVKRLTQDATLAQTADSVAGLPKSDGYLKLYSTLKGHHDKVARVRWSSDLARILLASQDGYMIVWDAVTGFKKHAITLDSPWVLTCAYSPGGRLVASAGLDNACTLYKVQQDPFDRHQEPSSSVQIHGSFHQQVRAVFKGHHAYISECDFIDDTTVVTASGDMRCMQWDVVKAARSRDYVDHVGDVLCMDVGPKGGPSVFVSGSSDGYAKTWDSRAPRPSLSFFVSNSDVNTIRHFPDGQLFATGSDDGIVRLFDVRADCELAAYLLLAHVMREYPASDRVMPVTAQLPLYKSSESMVSSLQSEYDAPGVNSVDFSHLGRLLYACYANYGCLVWDTLKNEMTASIGRGSHSNKISQVAVSPDGVGVCTASWDATVNVWST